MSQVSPAVAFLAIVVTVAVAIGTGYLWLRGLPRLIWAISFAPLLAWTVAIALFLISGVTAAIFTKGLICASTLIGLWVTVVAAPFITDLIGWTFDEDRKAENTGSRPLLGYIIDRRSRGNDAAYVLPGETRTSFGPEPRDSLSPRAGDLRAEGLR
ncbi:hypothetical protein [Brevundimonas sp.]|uniref:hypothetical protein n=1 Tax=Brevundimonas sp. TaxID=1871086 RepID=UPI003AFFA585